MSKKIEVQIEENQVAVVQAAGPCNWLSALAHENLGSSPGATKS